MQCTTIRRYIIEGLPLNILSKKEYNYAKVKVTEHSFYYRKAFVMVYAWYATTRARQRTMSNEIFLTLS